MSTKTTKRKRAGATATDTVPGTVPGTATSAVTETVTLPSSVEIAVVAAGSTPTIALSSNSTVKDAAALKDVLVRLLDEAAPVAIDAKSVERIDTAIMQLLCAFVRDRAERNLAVTWSGTPSALLDAARLLGIGSLLALPANS
jgi:ABC-type transporter Mla MlaB component